MKTFHRNKDPFAFGSGSGTQLKTSKRYMRHEWTPSGGKDAETLRSPVLHKRLLLIGGMCFVFLLVILIRVFSLQSSAETYKEMSDDNRIRILSQEAPRGIIFDRYNVPLTENSPDVAVFVTLDDLPEDPAEIQALLERLASYTHVPIEELKEKMDSLSQTYTIEPQPLIEHITHDQAITLSVHERDLPGVYLTPRILRAYTKPQITANILGYTGKITDKEWATLKDDARYTLSDPIGKTGIEKSYEDTLKGENGKQRVEVNAFGHVSKIVASQDPAPGENVTLSIDVELQQYLYDQLAEAVRSSGGKGASAVAQDPNTGEVLALVSWPSFDNNLFAKGITPDEYKTLVEDPMKPLFNRPISGEYPSGSTIKPLISASALQEGIISERTTVLSTGGIQIGQWNFPDWKGGGHGVTNVTKAIAESVNTFFYAISGGYEKIEGLGVDRIRTYAEQFGLNNPLGIDIQGEASGFLPTKEWKEETKGERWYIGDTYHLGIGQGDILVTPLQINSYIATIANGGTLYKPHLVHAIGDTNTKPEVIRDNIVSSANIRIVQKGMRETVLSGSARALQSVPVTVAAKTGTAEFGVEGKFHAWFTSFAPYENPEIALTILIESGGEGSSVAAPVAKNALTWWANNRKNAE